MTHAWPIRITLLLIALGLAAPPAVAAHPNAGAPTKQTQVTPRAKGPADRSGRTAEGIVQSLSAASVAVKQLDGTTVSVPVDTKTRVFVNGKPALLRNVKPGFVAVARWKAGRPAQELRTFDRSGQASAEATVESVSAAAVVATNADGSTVTWRVGPKTRVFIDGKAASLRDVKAGFILIAGEKSSKGGKPANELYFRRPS